MHLKLGVLPRRFLRISAITGAMLTSACAGVAAPSSTGSSRASCGPPRLLRHEIGQPVVGGLIGKPGRLLSNRCATFPLVLDRNGERMVDGSCYVHALQYEHYPWIEYRVNPTKLLLPAGTWVVRESLRDARGSGTGGHAIQSKRVLPVAGEITAHAPLAGMGGSLVTTRPEGRLMPSRIACGILAGHSARSFVPTVRVFATISWPSFRLLGINVPVEAGSPHGGLIP